jgi:hypothetical protein
MQIVPSKYRGTQHHARVLRELITAAEFRGVTTYQDIAQIMGLPLKGSHMSREVGWILGEISEDEHRAGRPMLSAVAVNVEFVPGDGFFELARNLGKLNPQADEVAFWKMERDAVYAAWRRPLSRHPIES